RHAVGGQLRHAGPGRAGRLQHRHAGHGAAAPARHRQLRAAPDEEHGQGQAGAQRPEDGRQRHDLRHRGRAVGAAAAAAPVPAHGDRSRERGRQGDGNHWPRPARRLMDPQLLRYYGRELQYIREMGAEFAREFPKIAGRLGLETFECSDPYVERLLEGFAFLSARIHLKIDAEFPRFTQHLLEIVYPHYLAPTPSMGIMQLQPNLGEGALAEGYGTPRGTALRSVLGRGDQTACEYRTAHDVTLWPLELTHAEYTSYVADLGDVGNLPRRPKGALRLKL